MPKDIRLNSTHHFIITFPNKQELYQIASHHSADIDFKDFTNLHKKCTAKPIALPSGKIDKYVKKYFLLIKDK